MIIDQLPELYDDCKMTLKETSIDDSNKKVLSESQLEVYNFDEVKKRYYKSVDLSKDMVGSCDALYVNKDTGVYLIEFKNTKLSNLKTKGEVNSRIKEKITGSLLILCDISKFCISETRHFVNFILVYSAVEARQHTVRSIKDRIEFKKEDDGMKKYEQIYYKQCLIMGNEKFQEDYVSKWEKGERLDKR